MSPNKPLAPSRGRRAAAFTLIELMIGIGLGGIIVTVILALTLYSGRNFASLANYTDMDTAALNAIDLMSRDIREANSMQSFSSNSITLNADTGEALTYAYASNTRTLTRQGGTNAKPTVILRECDSLNFSVFQRTPMSGTFDQYSAGPINESKVVFVTWTCSRTILGRKVNTDAASTARIVMRVP